MSTVFTEVQWILETSLFTLKNEWSSSYWHKQGRAGFPSSVLLCQILAIKIHECVFETSFSSFENEMPFKGKHYLLIWRLPLICGKHLSWTQASLERPGLLPQNFFQSKPLTHGWKRERTVGRALQCNLKLLWPFPGWDAFLLKTQHRQLLLKEQWRLKYPPATNQLQIR